MQKIKDTTAQVTNLRQQSWRRKDLLNGTDHDYQIVAKKNKIRSFKFILYEFKKL